jgi:hypothetical protein
LRPRPKTMQSPLNSSEAIYVGVRFRLALERTILALEAGAAHDEQVIERLDDPDHRRRQRLLVGCQLLRAFRLRELLARTALRPERAGSG